jgi:hypothetical protein
MCNLEPNRGATFGASFIHGRLLLFTEEFFGSPIGTVAGFINNVVNY